MSAALMGFNLRSLAAACMALWLALGASQSAAQSVPAGAYEQAWFRAAAVLMTIADQAELDPQRPAPATIAALKASADALEQATSDIRRGLPPPDGDAALHTAALPRLMHVVGAARDCLHAIETGPAAEIDASRDALDDAIQRAREAISRAAGGKL